MGRIADQGHFVPIGPRITLHGHHGTGRVLEEILGQVFNFLPNIGKILFEKCPSLALRGDALKRHLTFKRQE